MNKLRTFLFTLILTLAAAATTYAKSYDLELTAPARAGKVQLKPGHYTLTIEGDQATFRDIHREKFTTPVKTENGSTKFKDTNVNYAGDHIQAIQLGGSTTTVEFVE